MRIAVIFLFLCLGCNAEQLIYRSVGRQTIYGNAKTTRLVATGFLVMDPSNFKSTAIVGFSLNGIKYFNVVPLQKYTVHLVAGKNATFTVMAKAESPGTQFQGVLLEAVYLRGKNEHLTIGPQAGAFLPRVFASSAHSIGEVNGTKTSGEVVGSYVFDAKGTFISNQLETFDGTVARLTNYFFGRGYNQLSPPPAQ